jgi:hypothetical protein
MAANDRFTLRRPGERIHVLIREILGDQPLLTASVTGKRRDFSDRQLLHAFFRFPLMTLKVVAAINFEALRLWLKGVRLIDRHRAPEPPETVVGCDTGGGMEAASRKAAG